MFRILVWVGSSEEQIERLLLVPLFDGETQGNIRTCNGRHESLASQ